MKLFVDSTTVEETRADRGNSAAGGPAAPFRKRRFWKAAASICAAGALVFLGIQLVPAPPMTNPPVSPGKTIDAKLQLTPEVSKVLHGVCMNCHSNQTAWPWYSRVAPFSWVVRQDVRNARQAMNFSEWPADPGEAVANLTAACADLEGGRMPPARYRWIHPEARIPPAAAKAFCGWTRAEVSAILTGARGMSGAAATDGKRQ